MGKNNTIKDMYQEDRPYEKCERFGAENLTDAELLAVLLRTGTQGENSLQLAHRLIESDCSGRGILNIHRWTFDPAYAHQRHRKSQGGPDPLPVRAGKTHGEILCHGQAGFFGSEDCCPGITWRICGIRREK